MITLTLKKLLDHLQDQKKLDAKLQRETNQIYILLKIGDTEYPLFLRIFQGNELLQLLAFIPCNIKPEALNDTARLLHLLNKELDLPGFGMDESNMVIFYRCMIPAKNQQLDEHLLDAHINSIEVVCKTFAAIIVTVAFGATSYEEVLKKMKEGLAQQQKAKPKPKSKH